MQEQRTPAAFDGASEEAWRQSHEGATWGIATGVPERCLKCGDEMLRGELLGLEFPPYLYVTKRRWLVFRQMERIRVNVGRVCATCGFVEYYCDPGAVQALLKRLGKDYRQAIATHQRSIRWELERAVQNLQAVTVTTRVLAEVLAEKGVVDLAELHKRSTDLAPPLSPGPDAARVPPGR